MDSPSEDILENRLALIEKKMFGSDKKPNIYDPLPETNIVDSLLYANTFISSALSGREKYNALMQKLPEIEEYIKPDFESIVSQTDVKLEYILTLEPVIREYAQQCSEQQYKELHSFMGSDPFKNIPEMSEKLENMTLEYTKLSEQAEEVNKETREILSRYTEIITNISKTLIVLDAEVTKLEKAAETKKIKD